MTLKTNYSKLVLKLVLLIISLAGSPMGNLKAQSVMLKGIVIDENGMPCRSANIAVKGEKNGVITDEVGKFTIEGMEPKQYVLTVSSVGYKSVQVELNTDTLKAPLYIILPSKVQELDEIQVKANVEVKKNREESVSIKLLQEEFLKESKSANLIQTLNNIPGVNSMDVGTGISKPVIRGMGYYRVVVAQNGIKQEGQQWSSHHGVTIDQQSVGHVEVIKGPSSLQYGSGAIGGVINVLPEHIPLKGGLTGEISLIGKTKTKWLGGSTNLTYRKGDIYTNVTLTHNNYGDFKVPDTEYYWPPTVGTDTLGSHKVALNNQVYNTAGRESAVSATVGTVKSWGCSSVIFNYYSSKSGFFDWQGIQHDSTRNLHLQNDRDINLPWQEIDNYSVSYLTKRYIGDDKLEIALGYQSNITKEYDNLLDRNANRNQEREYYRNLGGLDLWLNLQTLTGNVVYSLNQFNSHQFRLGINLQYQLHQKDGYGHILPDYNRFSSGAFLLHRFNLNEKWVVNSGIRIDYNFFRMEETINPDIEDGDSVFNPFFQKVYPSTAFSFGMNYLPNKNTVIKFHLGKSYRVPSAYELGAYGLHRHEGRFEKGNINNNPEEAWQLDLGFERRMKKLGFTITPFLNYFTNYLFLVPTSLVRREGQVYEYRQTRAMLTGGEASLNYTLLNRIDFLIGAEYVYAVNLDLQSALPFTPPFSAQTEVNYHLKNSKLFTKSKVGFELKGAAKQKYTVQNELDTPGYYLFNLKFMTTVNFGKQDVPVILKVRNIFDQKYYKHTSFYRRLWIPEPGRDVQLFISIPIN